MRLFPYLPLSVARSLAHDLATMPQAELVERSSDWDDNAIFPPIGGERVDRTDIRRLQSLVRSRMHDAEISSERLTEAYAKFDDWVAPILLTEMEISPHEASSPGLWAFLTCIVLPDVVRWRFPGTDASGSAERRFLGGARGVKNTLGRLWWRAYVFGEPSAADPWALVRQVGEDQSVQIIERPFLSGHPPFARAILRAAIASGSTQQQDIVREAMVRLRRVGGAVPLEALSDSQLGAVVAVEVEASQRALAPSGTLVVAAPIPKPGPARRTFEEDAARPSEPVGESRQPAWEAPSAVARPGRALQARVSQAQIEQGPMQGIVVIPEVLAQYLPPLEESYANPEKSVVAVDEEGHRWPWLYVHYNRTGGGRRLVGLTPFLLKRGAQPGDLLRMTIGTGGMIEVRLEHGGPTTGA